jgi:hypothetical protein
LLKVSSDTWCFAVVAGEVSWCEGKCGFESFVGGVDGLEPTESAGWQASKF